MSRQDEEDPVQQLAAVAGKLLTERLKKFGSSSVWTPDWSPMPSMPIGSSSVRAS
jgi:hypothetical protein